MHMCLLAAHDGELWQWALKSLKCCERKMAMGAGCVNLVLNVGGRNKHDTVSEWPRRWTRNPLGSARRGLNPLAVGCLAATLCCDGTGTEGDSESVREAEVPLYYAHTPFWSYKKKRTGEGAGARRREHHPDQAANQGENHRQNIRVTGLRKEKPEGTHAPFHSVGAIPDKKVKHKSTFKNP